MRTIRVNKPVFKLADPNNPVRYSTAQGLINEDGPQAEPAIEMVRAQPMAELGAPDPNDEPITMSESKEAELMMDPMKKALHNRHQKHINLKITVEQPGMEPIVVDGNSPKPTPDNSADIFMEKQKLNKDSSLAPEVMDKEEAMEPMGEEMGETQKMEDQEMHDQMQSVQTVLPGKKPSLMQRAKENLMKKKNGK